MHPRLPITPKRARILALLLISSSFLSLLPTSTSPARADQGAAPLAFASPDFERVWTSADGAVASGQATRSWLWGPSPGVSLNEPFSDAPGGNRLVQYFDKARMELDSAVTDTTSLWRVTSGLLVTEMVDGKVQTGPNHYLALAHSQEVVAGDDASSSNPRYSDFAPLTKKVAQDRTGAPVKESLTGPGKLTGAPGVAAYARYVPETGHNVPDVFWSYMQQADPTAATRGAAANTPLFDWLYVMGYPIAEPVWASLTIGGKQQVALVQLFQRRVLTYVPSFPSGWQVQMGNAGLHYYSWRYGSAAARQSPSQGTTSEPTPLPQGGKSSFVSISGSSFVYEGSKVTLKGTNYWLSQAPFVGTWSEWNGPRVQAELEKAHQLGVNAVRVGIPYDHRDTMDEVWGDSKQMVTVGPWIKSLMTQFLQIASSYGMKVIFVLFEWYDRYPAASSTDEQTNKTYLQGIVGTFANDDRVLAWDLHNEPDFYETWQAGQQSDVIDWLRRMARNVRSLDSRHLVTVGLGNYSDLWYPASDGTTILSFVDFAALHCYDAGGLSGQITGIKARTTKPILLEEMGWPTALGGETPPPNTVFDETTQTFLYNSMLADSKSQGIAGVMQWTLWDYWGGHTYLVPGHERYFGLVRQDGSFKPAADVFKNSYPAGPLPSETHTDVPLDTSDKPNTGS